MTAPDATKRKWHFVEDCEYDHAPNDDTARKYKKLRSGLLNTRERDAPAAQKAMCAIINLSVNKHKLNEQS